MNYSYNFFILFHFFFRFNHISVEPNNDTTRTQMYLLSGMVYYDPPFYCNLTKPPSLLLSLSRPSLLMCSLRGPTWPARGSWWHSERNTPPTTPYPPNLGQEMFNHGLKSLTLNLLTSENVNGSIQRR